MPKKTAAGTAEIMSWADLHGIDTHGISMIPPYNERRRANKLDVLAETRRRERRARELEWADEMVRRGLAP